jgi:hypothetical protein
MHWELADSRKSIPVYGDTLAISIQLEQDLKVLVSLGQDYTADHIPADTQRPVGRNPQ